jgi:predicted DNA-binding protein YlxM (UPF0122 family)
MGKIDVDIDKALVTRESGRGFCEPGVFSDRLDVIRTRARLLAGRDRVLMKMYLDNGNSFGQIAKIAGVSESSISRKITRLTKRLVDNEYILCRKYRQHFDKEEMVVAKDYFVRGKSQQAIARGRGVSVYRIRKILSKIRGFANRDKH